MRPTTYGFIWFFFWLFMSFIAVVIGDMQGFEAMMILAFVGLILAVIADIAGGIAKYVIKAKKAERRKDEE